MDWQAVGVGVAAVAAGLSAISAGASWFSAYSFYRTLKRTSVDAFVAAAAALQGGVYKTIKLKANTRNDIPLPQILGAFEDAWAKWLVLNQTALVAQRYNKALREPGYDPVSKLARLLSELEENLYDLNWRPHGDGDPKDPKDIRTEVDRIVYEIHVKAGLPRRPGN